MGSPRRTTGTSYQLRAAAAAAWRTRTCPMPLTGDRGRSSTSIGGAIRTSTSRLLAAERGLHSLSTTKPPDPPFKFFPRGWHHRVRSVPVPELVTRPTPVIQQVQAVQLFAKIPVALGCVMNVERSLLGTTTLAPHHAVPPLRSPPHRPSHLLPVFAVQVSFVILSPSHESAFRVETVTLKRYLCRVLKIFTQYDKTIVLVTTLSRRWL